MSHNKEGPMKPRNPIEMRSRILNFEYHGASLN